MALTKKEMFRYWAILNPDVGYGRMVTNDSIQDLHDTITRDLIPVITADLRAQYQPVLDAAKALVNYWLPSSDMMTGNRGKSLTGCTTQSTHSPERRATMKFSDDQLAAYSNEYWGAIEAYLPEGMHADFCDVDVSGHIDAINAAASAAVTDVLNRMIDELHSHCAERAYHRGHEYTGLSATETEFFNLIWSFMPTPAPTADEEGDAE